MTGLEACRAQLQVWDALEVGPPQVERRRIRVPYVIHRGGERFETKITFRWNSDVLDPGKPEDHQLAALIGAQVALNYGLFCRRLVLHGPFDLADQRLLRDMAQNTASEIYVNKLLKPNPLLKPMELPVVRSPEQLMGEIEFPDGLTEPLPTAPYGAGVAVLSSGGKDSLLTLGLCEELGLEPHSLFVNESGRHWFTALNAWRHLEATRPTRTARVWSDCDRLYSFCLRQLPFVREDFDRVRADDYPVRLWTVAVFLFGVLPMMRARGLGTLLIGDEWDSTQKAVDFGLEHFAGYYDQSRFFDETLTRWFHRKGWNVVQCSVLRPLSELLIQDVLSARYPELFALQVSCHAASVAAERAVSCGRCEKCRRIVGMLVALGRDPGVIGYGSAAITACLAALGERGSKQVSEDAAHLAALLVEGGHLPASSPSAAQAALNRGTQCVRIDPLRSPANAVPGPLRRDTWRIFLEHAQGALLQRGARWEEVDLLGSELATQRHPFERSPALDPVEELPEGMPSWRLAELTWPQARRRFREVDVALLPVGAIEQHGLHLPLDIDTWDAAHQCVRVAAACSEPRPLVLPAIAYGVSYHHEDFAGTLSVSPETLAKMVHEVGLSAARNGIKKLVIVNGHGGNGPALHFAAQCINRDAHIFTLVDSGESSDSEIAALLETAGDAHAGEYETSMALATRPHLVYMQHARAEQPDFASRYLDFDSDVSVGWYARTLRMSETGTLGDPTVATARKGQRFWDITVNNMVELVEHLKATPLEQLYGRGRDI